MSSSPNKSLSHKSFDEETLLAAVPSFSQLESGLPDKTGRTVKHTESTPTNPKYRKRFQFPRKDQEGSSMLQVTGSYQHLNEELEESIVQYNPNYFSPPTNRKTLPYFNDSLRNLNMYPEGTTEWQKALKEHIDMKIKHNEALENSKKIDGKPPLVVLEHSLHPASPLATYCEVCAGVLFPLIHTCYVCSECKLTCHSKCAHALKRLCAAARAAQLSQYPAAVCPDIGLHQQNYRCFECAAYVSYQNVKNSPRICDFTGKYYCWKCRWNDKTINPVRVLINWDITPYNVCRSSLQLLTLLMDKPMIDPMCQAYPPMASGTFRLGDIMVESYILIGRRTDES